MKKVSVIIPVYNEWPMTRDCLLSLREHTTAQAIEVIVVDNGSSDATPQECPALGRALFGEDFSYTRLDVNKNFGPACNIGAAQAETNICFFLNNDTLLTENWLDPLLESLTENSRLGAVGPLLIYPDGRIQHLGVVLSPTGSVAHLYHLFPSDHRVGKRARRLQALTGAALMVPKAVFDQAGGFYEGYQNGFEDLDLCYQIRQLGFELTCIPQSRIVHLTSQSKGRFDANKENARLFTSRCRSDYKPDQHLFAHEDGFQLRFCPDFKAIFFYDEEPGTDIACIWEQILAEPLWEKGYAALQTFFREKKMWNELLDILLFKIQFFYSREIVMEILRTGTRLNKKDTIDSFRVHLEHFDRLGGAVSYKKCLNVRDYAMLTQDFLLLSACEEWLKNYRQ